MMPARGRRLFFSEARFATPGSWGSPDDHAGNKPQPDLQNDAAERTRRLRIPAWSPPAGQFGRVGRGLSDLMAALGTWRRRIFGYWPEVAHELRKALRESSRTKPRARRRRRATDYAAFLEPGVRRNRRCCLASYGQRLTFQRRQRELFRSRRCGSAASRSFRSIRRLAPDLPPHLGGGARPAPRERVDLYLVEAWFSLRYGLDHMTTANAQGEASTHSMPSGP